jgi:2-polyprenyl-3-methyl-5-hydroxy-6-metoxy-1,4-benzoquinol methylase
VSAPRGEACPACGGPEGDWASKNAHRLTRCRSCRTVLARRGDGTEPAGADYALYHKDASFHIAASTQSSLDALVAEAGRYRQLGRWLDVGFGEGALLRAAGRHGWDCSGVEVSPHALAFGRSCGWRVFGRDQAEGQLETGGYDVVTLVEVVEHLPDPIRALGQAVRWLRPGGLLFLSTPNANSLNARVLGPRWSVFCPPEHLTVWSPRGLRTALRGLGLVGLRVRTHGMNPVEILAAARWAGDKPVHRQSAAEPLNDALSRTAARRLVKRAANSVLSLLGIGDTIKVWCERPS